MRPHQQFLHFNRSVLVLTFIVCLVVNNAKAQEQTDTKTKQFASLSVGSSAWCEDSATYCWKEEDNFLGGIRIVAEPKFGEVFDGGNNRIASEGFATLSTFGVQTNLIGALLGLQMSVILPGRVQLDSQSTLRTENRLLDLDGQIDVDYGFGIGLVFMDGIISFGKGYVNYDERDIVNPVGSEAKNDYWYLNFQAVSAVRSTIKRLK